MVLAAEVVIALRFGDWPLVRGSLGDVLLIVLLYSLLRAITPLRPVPVTFVAVGCGFLAETAQLIGVVDRLGTVISSSFALADLVMYLLGGMAALIADDYLLGRWQRRC